MSNMTDFDIVIIGTGLVGTSLVVALQGAGLRVGVLETHVPIAGQSGGDGRPLSLAYGSQKILETLGIWRELAELAEPIQMVHVSEEKQLGTLCFRAGEERVAALGYVAPFEVVQEKLYQQAAQNQQVKFIPIQKVTGIQNSAAKTVLTVQTIEGEKKITTELLIAADGAHSPTRELLGIAAVEKQQDDQALTMLLELTQPHQHSAYERFTHNGVIAVLPLKNPLRCRLVWTISGDFAQEVSAWSDNQLADYLRAAMHDRLGAWRIIERGKAYPLETVLAQEQIRPGVVLLGNAAHTIYPLAAQGFNLGLRDAATLAEVIIEARKNNQMLGDESVLQSYVDWRSADQRWISGLTSGISQFFELHIPGLGPLRGLGLLVTDLIPPLKHRLARRLMGMAGKCPKLARGISL